MPIEKNVHKEEAIRKYADCYLVVMGGRVENGEIYGDIVHIYTRAEYLRLDKPKHLAPRFTFWLGIDLEKGEARIK